MSSFRRSSHGFRSTIVYKVMILNHFADVGSLKRVIGSSRIENSKAGPMTTLAALSYGYVVFQVPVS